MFGNNSYQFIRVESLDEISELVDQPYNRSDFSLLQSKEKFQDEFEKVDDIVRVVLGRFGRIDAFGEKEFSMGEPWNSSRKIGVTFNRKKNFKKEIILALANAIQSFSVDYLIVVSGEFSSGGGTFYICISKNGRIVGFAPERSMLEAFGF